MACDASVLYLAYLCVRVCEGRSGVGSGAGLLGFRDFVGGSAGGDAVDCHDGFPGVVGGRLPGGEGDFVGLALRSILGAADASRTVEGASLVAAEVGGETDGYDGRGESCAVAGGDGLGTVSTGESGGGALLESVVRVGTSGGDRPGGTGCVVEASVANGAQVALGVVEAAVGGARSRTDVNRAKRNRKAANRRARAAESGTNVPVWRRGARPVGSARDAVPSLAASVCTVDTESAEEIEARRTLASRRIMENKVAEATAKYRLESLQDPAKTKAVRQLSVVRLHERINTVRAKSEASFKKCGSPLESVGSAASAGEYALKQETRRRLAQEQENKNLSFQLDELLKIATPRQLQVLSELELVHVPTEAEIQAEDEDISPFYSMDEMEADAAKYFTTHAGETDDWLGR